MARRGRPRHPDILTPREWEVLALLREELSNEEIAERLNITERTARYHVSEILGKLGVSTRHEAAEWRPEEPRAWWGGAPSALPLLRGLKASWVASVTAGVVAIVVAAAAGFLVWGIAHTDGASSDSSISPTPQPFTELRAVNGVLSRYASANCGDTVTSQEYDVPQALEFSRDQPFESPALILGLEAVPYEYVREQLVSPLDASEGWEAAQRPLLYRSVPGGFFLPEFFLRRLDKPELVFRYGVDLCIQVDGDYGAQVYSGDRIDLPASLPHVITHRPPGNVTAQQAIAIGDQGAWSEEGARVVWAEHGNSQDFAATRGELQFPPLREDPEYAYWAVIIAMGDAGGPHRPGREIGTYVTIDGEDASIRSYGCCLDIVFAD